MPQKSGCGGTPVLRGRSRISRKVSGNKCRIATSARPYFQSQHLEFFARGPAALHSQLEVLERRPADPFIDHVIAFLRSVGAFAAGVMT
jgi:hypothetical protein